MLTLNIRAKLLVLILVASVIPIAAVNVYWIFSQRSTLTQDAKLRQYATTNDDADDVNTFTGNVIQSLALNSQDISLNYSNPAQVALELKTSLQQDPNIKRLALVNSKGEEVMAFANDGTTQTLRNDAQTDAFKAVNHNATDQYISAATFNAQNQPLVTIAVPVLAYSSPAQVAASATSQPKAFNGALIAQINFQVLGNSVLDLASNSGAPGSYAFVVDNEGNVIAYRKGSLNGASQNLASLAIVRSFMSQIGTPTISNSMQQTSEKDVQALASYQRITVANWAVVVEDPTSNIYQSINHTTLIGSMLAVVIILSMTLLSVVLSNFVSRPIKRLAAVAQKIGSGDLDARVADRRTDEIGLLGDNINAMSISLQHLINEKGDQARKLEVILNNTSDSILSIDGLNKVIIANDAAGKLFEVSSTDLIGQDIQGILHLGKEAKPVSIDYVALDSGTHVYRGLEYNSKGGLKHYVDIVAYKIAGDGKAIAPQTIITIHDETKNRELDSMKLDFVSMAAHELRTPLSAIQGYLELIDLEKRTQTIPEKVQKYVGQARASSRELASIIGNLLSVTHIEHGNQNLRAEKVDLVAAATESVKSLQFNADAKKIHLSYEGPNESRYVIGDFVAVKEVISNIVDNAIKYTPEAGTVTVTLSETPSDYTVKIKDSGIGIPKNAMHYLFTKFYRVHGGLASGSAGTGLGLFIAKSVVEDSIHKGTIAVNSEEGKGTEFIISLPVLDEDRLAELQKAADGTAPNKGGNNAWFTKNTTR